ncbi:alpha/beta fold hydrolase [Candidatus Dojkabacteria bacterium]|nr:alpha/beta fold hydrolase [Candidatus Dojkabacteria bacterium]
MAENIYLYFLISPNLQNDFIKKRLKIDRNIYKFYKAGKKSDKTVLFLPGYASATKLFTRLLPILSKNNQVYMLDYPTLQGQAVYSLGEILEYMKIFINSLEIKKLSLLGFSLGGILSYHLARSLDNKIQDLILINSFPTVILTKFQIKTLQLLQPLQTRHAFLKFIGKILSNEHLRNIVNASTPPQAALDNLAQHPISIYGTLFNIITKLQDYNSQETLSQFSKLESNKIIILFKDDDIFKYKTYSSYLKELNSNIEIYEEGGHMEKEEFWKNLESFFSTYQF